MKIYVLVYHGIDYDKILGVFDEYEKYLDAKEKSIRFYHPSDLEMEEWTMNEYRG